MKELFITLLSLTLLQGNILAQPSQNLSDSSRIQNFLRGPRIDTIVGSLRINVFEMLETILCKPAVIKKEIIGAIIFCSQTNTAYGSFADGVNIIVKPEKVILVISKIGYQTLEIQNLQVYSGELINLDIVLKRGIGIRSAVVDMEKNFR